MLEQWKNATGFLNYQVSNLGNVKGLHGIILKQHPNRDGYLAVTLYTNSHGNKKTVSVHRLVACTFIENPDGKREINHIDGDKSNNNVKNLEWNSISENRIHAYKTGLNFKKISVTDAIDIRKMLFEGISQYKIAEKYSVTQSLISLIKNNKIKNYA